MYRASEQADLGLDCVFVGALLVGGVEGLGGSLGAADLVDDLGPGESGFVELEGVAFVVGVGGRGGRGSSGVSFEGVAAFGEGALAAADFAHVLVELV